MKPELPLKKSEMSNAHRSSGDISHGLQFAMITLGGMVLGYWLDKKWMTSPWGFLLGMFLGAIVGMIHLARQVK